uniref:Taste receptor type 2 n=1 Tax=Catagonus wagneri TaxID=51154 RepID=A0A8C3WDK0_9CETA
MLSIVEGLFIFISVSESILGLLGNGFIGLVTCTDCVKTKNFSMISFILTGLATSRICLIWLIIIDGFLKIFFLDIYISGNLTEYFSYAWIIVNHSSIWFATSLSIFCFLKIANFSHHIFLWLKGKINRVLLILMVYLLVSWLFTFPHIVKIISDSKMKNGSSFWPLTMRKHEYFTNQILLNLGVFLLFILCMITCFLLIISLWRHNRQMQLSATGFGDPSTEAHVKAMKVLISFIILFVLYFIGIAIEISCVTQPENKLLFIFGMTTAAIFPWGHSFILILGNRKLKQSAFLACLCFFPRSPAPEEKQLGDYSL